MHVQNLSFNLCRNKIGSISLDICSNIKSRIYFVEKIRTCQPATNIHTYKNALFCCFWAKHNLSVQRHRRARSGTKPRFFINIPLIVSDESTRLVHRHRPSTYDCRSDPKSNKKELFCISRVFSFVSNSM